MYQSKLFIHRTPTSHLQVLAGGFSTRRAPRTSRRKGVALVYATLSLAGFLGATALVVDMGSLYTRRAQAQRAADAAALAGAWDLSKDGDGAAARATAIEYAALNGYAAPNSTVTVKIVTTSSSTSNDSVEVSVSKREPLFFMPAVKALLAIPSAENTSVVGAHATAQTEFASEVVNLSISEEYGSANDEVNPSIFGPDSKYEYGDAFSPRTLNDGTTPNPGYDKAPGGDEFTGYEYKLTIPKDYKQINGTSQVQVELFDPDCYVTDSGDSLASWDELHDGNGANNVPTVTRYTLYSPLVNGVRTEIASATYGGDANNPADVDANLKWTTPDGFTFNIDDRGTGDYLIRVKSESGVSENGFQFRAGPARTDPSTLRTNLPEDVAEWKLKYDQGGRAESATGNGTSFSAVGTTPFNFTRSGTVKIKLGFVPGEVKGGKIYVDKFDNDVGAKSITYSYVRADNQQEVPVTKPGTLSSNGTWGAAPDSINVDTNPEIDAPDVTDYPTEGGVWYATYEAGAYDTSTWKMSYTGETRTGPKVRLID